MEELKIEFIEKLKEEVKKFYRMDDLLDEHYNEEGYKDIKFVETLSTDEHRWYILEENVYKVTTEDKEYYFGVLEVGSLKSEMMTAEDTGVAMELFEVEKIVRETFTRKR